MNIEFTDDGPRLRYVCAKLRARTKGATYKNFTFEYIYMCMCTLACVRMCVKEAFVGNLFGRSHFAPFHRCPLSRKGFLERTLFFRYDSANLFC